MNEWRNDVITNVCIDFETVLLLTAKPHSNILIHVHDDGDYIFIFTDNKM